MADKLLELFVVCLNKSALEGLGAIVNETGTFIVSRNKNGSCLDMLVAMLYTNSGTASSGWKHPTGWKIKEGPNHG